MEFRLLGPLDVRDDRGEIPVTGHRTRTLLCALLVRAGEVVPTAQLIDALWGDQPPAGAVHALHAQASKLRAALRNGGAEDMLVASAPGGYRLELDGNGLDLLRFERLVAQGRAELDAGDAQAAVATLRSAEALWRGAPLTEFSGAEFAQPIVTRLAELHRSAIETRLDAQLACGRAAALVAELEGLAAADPLREQLRGLLMLALYRSGQQARALEVYRQTRDLLADELGLDPSPDLQDLHRRILAQDPTLIIGAPTPVKADDAAPAPPAEPPPPADSVPGPALWRGKRLSRRWLSALAAVLVLAAALTVVLTTGSGGGSYLHGALRQADVVTEYDTNGHPVAQIPVGKNPRSITAGAGSLWVTNADDNTVTRIDPKTGTEQATIAGVGSGPTGIAVAGGSAWVVSPDYGAPLATATATVTPINTVTNTATRPISGGPQASGIASGAGRIWVAVTGNGQLYSFAATDPTRWRPTDVGTAPTAVAVTDTAVWVTNAGDETASELDPATGTALHAPIQVGIDPTALAVGAGGAWVANHLDGTVTHIDPTTDTVRRTIKVGDGPSGIAITAHAVWVTTGYAGQLVRIDPTTDTVTGRFDVPGAPTAIAAVGNRLFVASATSYRGHRGGRLRAVIGGFTPGTAFPILEPATNADYVTTLVGEATTDSLVAYARGAPGPAGDALVPDLAEALPSPQPHATQYLFRLRPGIRFSTGAVVTAHDVRASLERTLRIGVGVIPSSPLTAIVGASACLKRPANHPDALGPPCDLSRGIVINDAERTVRFRLLRPEPGFIAALADLTTAIVPSGTPAVSWHDIFHGEHPYVAGTGPYMISRFDWPHHIVLTRNPYFRQWSRAAQPDGYVDSIDIRIAPSSPKNLSDIEQGRIDYLDDQDIPPAQVRDAITAHPVLQRDEGNPTLGLAFLNSTRAPFDNLLARKALNFAIDRAEVIRDQHLAASFVPTCQIIPRGATGYHPYCPYTIGPTTSGTWRAPDLTAAKRLVRESGTFGQRVEVWGPGSTQEPPSAPFVKALNEIGYHATLHKPFKTFPDYVDAIMRDRPQIGMAGYSDSADGADALNNMICHGYGNFGHFCDRRTTAQYYRAVGLEATDPPAGRLLLAKIDRELVNDAAVVPILDSSWFALTSARVGNWSANLKLGPLIGNLWVK